SVRDGRGFDIVLVAFPLGFLFLTLIRILFMGPQILRTGPPGACCGRRPMPGGNDAMNRGSSG
ncbi:hypothetical protein ACC719_36855, partial [Rhizobium ruizarguesonis]